MQASISEEEAWEIWRHGYMTCESEKRKGRALRRLFAGRPPECKVLGGPCIGRAECKREEKEGTTE